MQHFLPFDEWRTEFAAALSKQTLRPLGFVEFDAITNAALRMEWRNGAEPEDVAAAVASGTHKVIKVEQLQAA